MSLSQALFGIPFVFWNIGAFRTSFWVLAIYGIFLLWRKYGHRSQARPAVV